MKKYIKNGEETTNRLTNWVGVVFDDEFRGVVLDIGDAYHIICSRTHPEGNISCGGREDDGSSIINTLDKWENDKFVNLHIKAVYCFDSYHELMTWFVDGIND